MFFALLGAFGIGISLGLMGSGGSILTVPILHYVVGQDEKVAIAGSLMIVGGISLVGGLQYLGQGLVDLRKVGLFGVPGMGGTYGGAVVSRFVPGAVQLLVFAAVMVTAAWFMHRPAPGRGEQRPRPAPWKIALDGLAVGLLTGFVGVGGGFLILPALVLLGGLSMQRAVGTSLLIIALNSFVGFTEHLHLLGEHGRALDWTVIWTFLGVGVLGSVGGRIVGGRLPQEALRRGFAWLLLVVGAVIIVTTLLETGGTGAAASSR